MSSNAVGMYSIAYIVVVDHKCIDDNEDGLDGVYMPRLLRQESWRDNLYIERLWLQIMHDMMYIHHLHNISIIHITQTLSL